MLFYRFFVLFVIVESCHAQYYPDRYVRPFWPPNATVEETINNFPNGLKSLLEFPNEKISFNLTAPDSENPMKTLELFFPFCETLNLENVNLNLTITSSKFESKILTISIANDEVSISQPSEDLLNQHIACDDQNKVKLFEVFNDCRNCEFLPMYQFKIEYTITLQSSGSAAGYLILPLNTHITRDDPFKPGNYGWDVIKPKFSRTISQIAPATDLSYDYLSIDVVKAAKDGTFYVYQKPGIHQPGYSFSFDTDYEFSFDVILYEDCKLSVSYSNKKLTFGNIVTLINPNMSPLIFFDDKKFIIIERHSTSSYTSFKIEQKSCDDSAPLKQSFVYIVPIKFEAVDCSSSANLRLEIGPSSFIVTNKDFLTTTAKVSDLITTANVSDAGLHVFLMLIPVICVFVWALIALVVYFYISSCISDSNEQRLEEIKYQ